MDASEKKQSSLVRQEHRQASLHSLNIGLINVSIHSILHDPVATCSTDLALNFTLIFTSHFS